MRQPPLLRPYGRSASIRFDSIRLEAVYSDHRNIPNCRFSGIVDHERFSVGKRLSSLVRRFLVSQIEVNAEPFDQGGCFSQIGCVQPKEQNDFGEKILNQQ